MADTKDEMRARLRRNHERVEDRLTGLHETCSYKDFKYGVSDRGASVRIPWHVARDWLRAVRE